MPKFRFVASEPHHVALGLTGRVIEPDEVFEVSDEDAPMFSQSPDRFQPVDNPAKKAVKAEKES